MNANTTGSWDDLQQWPLIGLHAIVMDDGRVLTFGTDDRGMQGGQFIYDIYDPKTGQHQTLENTTPTDIFCSAAMIIPGTNKILIAGGDARPLGSVNKGVADVNILDMDTGELYPAPDGDMAFQRWYPTMVSLPDGRMVMLGGTDINGRGVSTPEIYTYGEGWTTLSGAVDADIGRSALYPRAFVNDDGDIIYMATGRGTDSEVEVMKLDVDGNGSLTQIGSIPFSVAWDAPAVMYEAGKILIQDTQTGLWSMDINGDEPSFTRVGTLSQERNWSNMTTLADGTVLINGGTSVGNTEAGADHTAVIWNPNDNSLTYTVDEDNPRLYHSASVLLSDGTLLSLGGGSAGMAENNYLDGQVYRPPYLYDDNGNPADRPLVTDAPEDVDPGETFTIKVDTASDIQRLTLVQNGAATHALNMGTRMVELEFTLGADNTLEITMPELSEGVTAGSWMLFAWNSEGVPSVAPIINVNPVFDTGGNLNPDNLLDNGSFEVAGIVEGAEVRTYVHGWEFTKQGVELWRDGFNGVAATDGNTFIEVDDSLGLISQTVTLEAGKSYDLSFDYAGRPGHVASSAMEVLWNGEVIATITPQDDSSRHYEFSVTGVAGDNTVGFRAREGDTDTVGGLLDKVELVADPDGGGVTEQITAEYFNVDANRLSDIDFAGTSAVHTETMTSIDANTDGAFYEGGRADYFAARYTGGFEVSEAGIYTFYLNSDDGSNLSIDGLTVIDNDGLHAAREVSVDLYLDAGTHEFQALYFEKAGLATMELDWSGPNFSRQLFDVTGPTTVTPNPNPPVTGEITAEYFDADANRLFDIDFAGTPAVHTETMTSIDENTDGAFYEGGRADFFAARYTGGFEVSEAGIYTFFLNSDDGSNLSIDGLTVIKNDGLHAAREVSVELYLDAGTHDFQALYFEKTGHATMELDWAGPNFSRQTFDVTGPTLVMPKPPVAGQITAEYFDADANRLSDIDFAGATAVHTETMTSIEEATAGAFYEGGRTDYFAARYTGGFEVSEAGVYTFYLNSDDGSNLSIDGQTVIDNDGLHAAKEVSVELYLDAGTHDFQALYFEKAGLATMELDWSGPGFSRQTFEVTGSGPETDLIVNGDLEALTMTSDTYWQAYTNDEVPGWQNASENYLEQVTFDGTQALDLDARGVADMIYQDVQTSEGRVYDLNFDVIRAVAGTSDFDVLWNDEVIARVSPSSGESFNFEVVGTGGSDRLAFRELASQNNFDGAYLDNIELLPADVVTQTANQAREDSFAAAKTVVDWGTDNFDVTYDNDEIGFNHQVTEADLVA